MRDSPREVYNRSGIQVLRDFITIVDLQTLAIVSLSCAATYLCLHFKITAELPTALIGIAIVFPIVFSINAAYRRREEALRHYAILKGHLIALYYASRDWPPRDAEQGGDGEQTAAALKQVAIRLIKAIAACLTDPANHGARLKDVYAIFSDLSTHTERLRDAGVSGSEVSRANQYVRAIIIAFESILNIATYRTPIALRAYSKVFLNSFPIVFAPHFAHLSTGHGYFSGFLVAVVYSLVLVSLDNIQEHLEDPFDAVGIDDIRLDVSEEYEEILA